MSSPFARIRVPPSVTRGEDFEVRISIRHPMETGFRLDDMGKRIARNTIPSLTCRYDGNVVLAASLGSGVAANPYLRFFVRAGNAGKLTLEWVDDTGEEGRAEADVVVAG